MSAFRMLNSGLHINEGAKGTRKMKQFEKYKTWIKAKNIFGFNYFL